jgi:eukaryotic-like serine/threonine-protein kinase
MTDLDSIAAKQDDRVEAAAAEYLRAADGGVAPSRVEFLARFPDLAAELAEFLDDLDRFHLLDARRNGLDGSGFAAATAVPSTSDTVELAEPPVNVTDHEVLGVLARGGMGVVYRARQTSLDRVVALKMIAPDRLETREDRVRFLAEAAAAAALDHPNIVPIYEVGEADGRPYFTMKLVHGGSLAESARGISADSREAAALVAIVARAVHFAHQRGILHRDLKPRNILMDADGAPLVADFGLAKRLDGSTDASRSGVIVGTPSYMAPEQARGDKGLSTAVDVYGLGAILYELLSGRPPFRAATAMETLVEVMTGAPARPRFWNPAVPPDLEAVCLKCLARDPAGRYASAAELADDLDNFRAGRPIIARHTGMVERAWRLCRRNRMAASLAASVGLLLVVGTTGATVAALRLNEANRETRGQLQRAEEAETRLEAELLRTETAERDKTDKLWQSYLDRARAGRFSQRAGQRFDSLRALSEAARIRFDPRLRDEAIASLALPDVHQVGDLDIWPAGSDGLDFDDSLTVCARSDAEGTVTVIRLADGIEVGRLPGDGGKARPTFSPDGKFLVVHQFDRGHSIALWRPADAKPFLVLDPDGVSDVKVRPDGRQIAVAHGDGLISLYDVSDGHVIKQIRAGQAKELTYDPTGRWLAANGSPYPTDDGQIVRVFSAADGAFQAKFDLEDQVASIAWFPDGRTLAAGGFDLGRIRLWDVTSRALVREPTEHQGGNVHLGVSRIGDVMASTSKFGHSLRLWHAQSGAVSLKMPGTDLVFRRSTPDGRLFAWKIEGTHVQLWEADPGREYRTLATRPGRKKMEYFTPAVSPDGRMLAVGLDDGVGLWDLEYGHWAGSLPTGTTECIAFDRKATLWTYSAKGVQRWPTAADPAHPGRVRVGPPTTICPAEDPVRSMSVSADGRVIAFAADDFATVIHTALPGSRVKLAPLRDARNIAVSPDGRWVATGSHWHPELKVWDVATGLLVRDIAVTGELHQPQFSPDGKWLATRNALWEVGTWNAGPAFPGDHGSFDSRAFSPDGLLMALESGDGALLLFEPLANRTLARLENPTQSRAACRTFTPDGTRIVFSDNDGQAIRVWDLRRLREHLAKLGLDWQGPPYSQVPRAGPLPPLSIDVRPAGPD